MPSALFISDLHLSGARPAINELFFRFLRTRAAGAEALYILGDLFDYWIGDDDLAEPLHASVARALRAVSERGVPLYLMHGNRDFLLGEAFCAASGARLLDDPAAPELPGARTLLMHGDTLCTDDVEYQRFRGTVRDKTWQREFLAQPLAGRHAQAEALRAASERGKSGKPPEIMDVSQEAVRATLRAHGYPRLIHGHTHRPARHEVEVDGRRCERWVLPDWYERGGYLELDDAGARLVQL